MEVMNITTLKNILTPVFEKYNILFAYLFGSMAKGDISPISDVDLAVYIQSPDKNLLDLKLQIHADICRVLKSKDVDLVILNHTKNLILIENIIKDSIILYDSTPTVREEFELKIQHLTIDFKAHRKAIMEI
jgi:hypothetical protein